MRRLRGQSVGQMPPGDISVVRVLKHERRGAKTRAMQLHVQWTRPRCCLEQGIENDEPLSYTPARAKTFRLRQTPMYEGGAYC